QVLLIVLFFCFFVQMCCYLVYQNPNIARGGNVIQSSLYGNEVPERAIDGNRASNLGQGSCTHTKKDLKPWWRLDLLKTYQISNVTITNRGDCCAWRIDGAEIRIGNSLDDNGNAGSSQTFVCNGMEGRYVNIVIPGRQEYLTLCEVEVTGQCDSGEEKLPFGKKPQ
uniref:Fucolectin tachylectin-4 pentraxin-1 domain-containing protein n=1 Tax=Sander lucioperca TaxID=283035 RepID=A0A8D0D996_SANLU